MFLLSLGGCIAQTSTLDPDPAPATSTQSSDPPSPSQKIYSKNVLTPALSGDARAVAEKLDEGSLSAAEKLLDSALEKSPSDAGLYAQKARLLALRFDLLDDALDTVKKDTLVSETFWDLCQSCVQFDSGWKPYVVHLVLGTVAQRAREHVDRKTGFSQNFYFRDGTDRYLVDNVGAMRYVYEATKLDTETARVWAAEYGDLAADMARGGFAVSAIWLANSQGDMLSGCVSGEDRTCALAALNQYAEARSFAEYVDISNLQDALNLYAKLYSNTSLTDEQRESVQRLQGTIESKCTTDQQSSIRTMASAFYSLVQ